MFKVRIKSLGSELVYKIPLPEEEKPLKLTISIFGKGVFDSIALFFLDKCSYVFRGLKPLRITMGDKKISKIYATQKRIENFMYQETKTFLANNKQDITNSSLRKNIKEVIAQFSDKDSISLPRAVEMLHKSCLREYTLMERSLFTTVLAYYEALPVDKKNQPLPFTITQNNQVECPGSGKGLPMQLTFNNNQIVIKTVNPTEDAKIPPLAKMLIGTFNGELQVAGIKTPAGILNQAIEDNIRNEYISIIGHEIPISSGDPKNNEIILKTSKNDLPLKIHNITLRGNHYIASHNWSKEESAKMWAMVFQQRPALIVKLTNEKPTEDDPLYWPDRPGLTWTSTSPLVPSVTCKSCVEVNEDLCKRVFELKLNGQVFEVTHLDYVGWEDLNVPKKASFESLLKEVDNNCPKTTPEKRLMVHCGAGIGRTGTFLAAHTARKLPKDQIADGLFYKLIMEMRRQRPLPMVETAEQYHFLHQLV